MSLFTVRETNSENCFDLIFVASPCEKNIFVFDENYITYTIRKFLLDLPSSRSLQNTGFKSEPTRLRPCGSDEVKIEEV